MITDGSCAIVGGGLIATAGALAIEKLGTPVTVVTRAPPPFASEAITWNYGDVSSSAALEAVGGAQSVVYAAGTLGPATELASVHEAITEEIVPVLKLAEAAAVKGVRTFIFISSGGTVYGPNAPLPAKETLRTDPINMYGTIKALTEQALFEVGRKHGIAVVVLRVSNPYGPGQSGTRRQGFVAAAVKTALAAKPIVIWGDGSTTRDFIHLDDVGRAVAAATAYYGPSVTLNIGSGQEHSLLDVCSIVSRYSREPLKVHFDEGRSFDVPRSCLDISQAASVLGWSPTVFLEEGIADTMRSIQGMTGGALQVT